MRPNRHAAHRDRSTPSSRSRRSRTSPHWNRSLWNPHPERTLPAAPSAHPADPEGLGLATWLERSRLARPLGFDVLDRGVTPVTPTTAAPLTRDPRQQARFASAFFALGYRALRSGWPGAELATVGGCLERLVMDLATRDQGLLPAAEAEFEFRAPPALASIGTVADAVEAMMREAVRSFERGTSLERMLVARPLETLTPTDLDLWFQDRWAARLFMLPARLAILLGSRSERVSRELEVTAREFARATWYRLDVALWGQIASGLPLADTTFPRLSPALVAAHEGSAGARRQLLARCLTDGGRSPLQQMTAARLVEESGALTEVQEQSQDLLRQVHDRIKSLGGSGRLARMGLDIFRA